LTHYSITKIFGTESDKDKNDQVQAKQYESLHTRNVHETCFIHLYGVRVSSRVSNDVGHSMTCQFLSPALLKNNRHKSNGIVV